MLLVFHAHPFDYSYNVLYLYMFYCCKMLIDTQLMPFCSKAVVIVSRTLTLTSDTVEVMKKPWKAYFERKKERKHG